MAFRYSLWPTTQNAGSYWRKSDVRSALHTPRAFSTHLREKPWEETQCFPCSAKTIAKNSLILAEAICQVLPHTTKTTKKLNPLLPHFLPRSLFPIACLGDGRIYLDFQNTYFYLKCVIFYCCQKDYCHVSLRTVRRFVEIVDISC